jgi:hypothetical protein
MRRRSVFAAAAVALAPLLLFSAPPASAAAPGSLAVTTIGRDGKPVVTGLYAANVTTFATYTLTSGRAKRLPKGRYDVIVDIWNSRDGTDTLAARRVTVAGAARATIDARHGRAVRAVLKPGPPRGYSQRFNVGLCVTDGYLPIEAWADRGNLYVIPSALPSAELAYSSAWTPTDPNSHDPRYLTTSAYTGGLPNGIAATVRRSSLATVNVTAYRGPVSGRAEIELADRSGDACASGAQTLDTDATLPYSYTVHVSPGSWQLSEAAQDYSSAQPHQYHAGKTYNVALNHAAWGPNWQLPYTWAHQLYLNVTDMFADAHLPTGPGAVTTYRLSKAGKTLVARRVLSEGVTLNPRISAAGWYTLTETATRHPKHRLPAGTLSTRTGLNLHFYANPATNRQVRVYLTRFRPAGLNRDDQARPGANTTVALTPQRDQPADDDLTGRLADSVKTVQAWASTDRGRTWRVVRVRHAHGAWTAIVHDPRSGTVSLRSRITDTHGDTAMTSIIDAYGVS